MSTAERRVVDMKMFIAAALMVLLPGTSLGETVDVKYRGPVPLATFDCLPLKPSSFVNRICYDKDHEYLIVQLDRTYYQYCAIDHEVVNEWVAAPSLGRFYNTNIKGRGFDCRDHTPPEY